MEVTAGAVAGVDMAGGEELLKGVASDGDFSEFEREGRVCFYFHFRDVAVFQVMGFRESGHVRLELRRFT